jgi:methyl-accepting chemotaxis protein
MPKIEFNSMGQRITTFVIIILLVVCTVVGIVFYKMSANAILNEVEQALLNFSKQCADNIMADIEKELDIMEIIGHFDTIASPEVEIDEKLAILRSEMEVTEFRNMGIVDTEGNMTLSNNQKINISDREYFQRALRGETCVGDPIFNREDGSFTVPYVNPIHEGDTIYGVLIGDRDANFLSSLTDEMGFGERGYALIVNSQGLIIAHDNKDYIYNQVDFRELAKNNPEYKGLAQVIENMVAQKHNIEEYRFEGENRVIGYHPIGDTGWSLAIDSFKDEILAGSIKLRNIILALSLGTIVLGAVFSLWMGRKSFAIIEEAEQFANIMADGDFSAVVPDHALNRKDEIGSMAKSFDRMQKSLKEMFFTVKQGADKVHASSEALASSSEEMNAGLEEVSASANEFAGTAQNLSESSDEMYKLGTQVSKKAQGGYEAVEKAVSQMEEISKSVAELQENVTSLNSKVDRVGNIVDTIKGIAGQTNLLALNAAIEAARAGEQGRGFAVVAEEVRKLAEQSASSAEEITTIIESIQAGAFNVAQQMAESIKDVGNGTEAVNSAGSVLKSIIEEIQAIVERIEQVAAATQEISSGSEEVSAAVEEQTATMNEIANAANDLQGLVEDLNAAVEKFKF